MQPKQVKGIMGAVLGVIGLILTTQWGQDALVFLHGLLSVGLLIGGVWLFSNAFGLRWQEIGARLINPAAMQSSTSGTQLQDCPHCQHKMPIGLQFCRDCGQTLPQPCVCPNCHQTNLPDAGFCGACGTRLESQGLALAGQPLLSNQDKS